MTRDGETQDLLEDSGEHATELVEHRPPEPVDDAPTKVSWEDEPVNRSLTRPFPTLTQEGTMDHEHRRLLTEVRDLLRSIDQSEHQQAIEARRYADAVSSGAAWLAWGLKLARWTAIGTGLFGAVVVVGVAVGLVVFLLLR